jgi:transposase
MMERREALLQQVSERPREFVEQVLALEEQLRKKEEVLREKEEQLRRKEEELAQAQAFIEELKRQRIGHKAEKLSREEEAQIEEIVSDLREQRQGPEPLIQQVLAEERKTQRERRAPRHPLPIKLEMETVFLEPKPEDSCCPSCGPLVRIGEEVSEEMDWVPAKLIRRRTIRPKYAACRCGQRGMTIAPLPPRLLPQSKLGLGLAVYIVLARYADHLAFYCLEKIFRERHGVEIPRQQMVQWVGQIANWLKPLYEAMWAEMKAGGYVQLMRPR